MKTAVWHFERKSNRFSRFGSSEPSLSCQNFWLILCRGRYYAL
jgi:hypothetical protein